MNLGVQKIALICDQPSWTGIGNYAIGLYKFLINEGVDVKLVYTGSHHDKKEFYYDYESFKRTSKLFLIPLFISINNRRSLRDTKLKNYEFHYTGASIKTVTKRPGFVTIHDLIRSRIKFPLIFRPIKFIKALFRNFTIISNERALRKAYAIFTVSERVKREIERRFGIQAFVIYTPVDEEVFNVKNRDEALKDLDLSQNFSYILAIGNDRPLKRLDLIKSFSDELPKNWRLLKIGARIASPNTINLGRIEHVNRYSEYFSASRAYLHMSDDEGLGLPLIEAILTSTPVIARKVDINKEILGNAAIYIVENDLKLEVDRVLKILETPDFVYQFTEAIMERKVFFTKSKALETLLSIYENFGSMTQVNKGGN